MSVDYNYRINMAIRKLFVLSSTRTYTIERELSERFAKVYPEFDPAIHTYLDATQSDLEKAKYARQRRQSKAAAAMRQPNRSQGLTHQTICDETVKWVNQSNGKYIHPLTRYKHSYSPGDNALRVQGLNVRVAHERKNNANNNQNNDDGRHRSLVSTEQTIHDSSDRLGDQGIPGRRRHNTLVVAPFGGEVNHWLEN